MSKVDINKILVQNILRHADIGIHVIDDNRKTIFYNDVMAGLDRKSVV